MRTSLLIDERKKDLLAFIADLQVQEKEQPTIRQIGEAVGISSTSVVNYYLNGLRKAGLVEKQPKFMRGVRLTPSGLRQSGYRLVICGHCGSAIYKKPVTSMKAMPHSKPSRALPVTVE